MPAPVIGFVLAVAIVASNSLQARTFVPFGVANGLEARMAVSVIIDDEGYLWVASREGRSPSISTCSN